MKYIIESKSFHIINKFIESIKTKYNVSKENYFSFDYSDENNFNNVYTQYVSINLFDNSKLIVLRSANFINDNKLNKIFENNLIDILNLKTDNILIFVVDKINKNSEQFKKMKPKFKILKQEPPKGKSLIDFVKNYLKKYNIEYDKSIIKSIIYKIDDNFDYLVNELKKLKLLNSKLTQELVDNIVYDYKGETIFNLIDVLINKNVDKLEILLNCLREKGYTSINLLDFLINEIMFILQIKNHYNNSKAFYSKSVKKLSQEIETNIFRLFKLIEHSKKWNANDLLEILIKLNEINITAKKNYSSDLNFWSNKKIIELVI